MSLKDCKINNCNCEIKDEQFGKFDAYKAVSVEDILKDDKGNKNELLDKE